MRGCVPGTRLSRLRCRRALRTAATACLAPILLLATPWGSWRFVERGRLTFRQVDGPYGIAFREDGRGRVAYLFTDLTPMFAFERLRWYETSGFNMALLLACALVLLSAIPAGAVWCVRSRRASRDGRVTPDGARATLWVIVGVGVVDTLFLAGTVRWAGSFEGYGVTLGVPTFYRVVLGLGVVSVALTAAALVCTALAWRNRYWGVAARAYVSLVTGAAAAFVWFLNYWNLLGWRF